MKKKYKKIGEFTVSAIKTELGIQATISKNFKETLPFSIDDPFDLSLEELENIFKMTPQEMFIRESRYRNDNPSHKEVHLFESKALIGEAKVKVKLSQEDGNIFSILGRCQSTLKAYGYREDSRNFVTILKRIDKMSYEETLAYLGRWFNFC